MSTSTLQTVVRREDVMGTVVSLHVDAPTEDVAHGAVAAAVVRLHELDAMLSLWRTDSPATRLRAGALLERDAPPELREVLETCRTVSELSGGWFDAWAMPGGVDPTGLAKGWVLESVADQLRDEGCTSAIVNGGGDVAFVGAPPAPEGWRTGVQHPWRRGGLAAIVVVTSAIATSGSYERGPHLIDPRRGTPSLAAASATVVGERLAIADGLATGLAVGGDDALEVLESAPGYEGYLIRADGTEVATAGFPFA